MENRYKYIALDISCKILDADMERVLTQSRRHELVKARYISFWLLRECMGYSPKYISELFGMENNSKVRYGIRKVESWEQIYSMFRGQLMDAKKKFDNTMLYAGRSREANLFGLMERIRYMTNRRFVLNSYDNHVLKNHLNYKV